MMLELKECQIGAEFLKHNEVLGEVIFNTSDEYRKFKSQFPQKMDGAEFEDLTYPYIENDGNQYVNQIRIYRKTNGITERIRTICHPLDDTDLSSITQELFLYIVFYSGKRSIVHEVTLVEYREDEDTTYFWIDNNDVLSEESILGRTDVCCCTLVDI